MPRQTVSTSRPTPSHLGKGPSSRFVEPRSGQPGEYTLPYSSPPPASSARRASASSNSPHECLPVEPGLEDVRLVVPPECLAVLHEVEPLAVHPVRQSGPLARERPDLPLEPREGPLALDSELLRERLKLPEQVVQPHRGQELGHVRLLEHRPLEAIVCFNCLAVSQRGPDRGHLIHPHRFSCPPIRGCSPRRALPYSPRSAPLRR